MKELGKRTIQISIALGAIVGLIGCGEEASNVETPSHDLGLTAMNGLSALNGLSRAQRPQPCQRPQPPRTASAAQNGLSAMNGLSSPERAQLARTAS